MIEFANVNFSYENKPVLNNFNLNVADGQKVCLFGESGCGKSTIIDLAVGILKPDSGLVTAPNKCSVVFQNDRLLPWYSVIKNVTLPLKNAETDFAENLLCEMGLKEYINADISTLSGGMKRRVAIARALLYSGDVLFLDEAFNGIDEENKIKIIGLINRYFKNRSILMVSHIKQDAELMGPKIIEL